MQQQDGMYALSQAHPGRWTSWCCCPDAQVLFPGMIQKRKPFFQASQGEVKWLGLLHFQSSSGRPSSCKLMR